MRWLVMMVALGMILGLASTASADKAKKKNKGAVRGQVTAVSAEGKTITVKLGGKKNPQATEKTFKFTDQTTVEKVSGPKGNKQTTKASLADLKAGERVAIKANGEIAADIKIVGKGKKKKAQ